MHVDELSTRTQDYLKALWDLQEKGLEPAPMSELASRVGHKPSAATEAVKKLAAQGWVEHVPYAGVSLTCQGHEVAVSMVRRHRLIETLLVNTLGFSWDEVHAEAERLEHAVSDTFISRVDALLGHPVRDPHGDPIPQPDGSAEGLSTVVLANVQGPATVEQVDDADPELLRFFSSAGILPEARVELISSAAGLCTLRVEGKDVVVAESVLSRIRVR
ncbi:metal-dependent transcriptional regulator [Corynebacterium tapiri]|uniref:Diphtheria toxin repressor n=1 Tax=Corynebacterium tapiri TaxID=1448266 RepID=A0A5C4U4I6_9CORY|nr:metal-dependent transcriptional regulator [Corynebacterium tapiri]TNL98481.1 metal-dependent transcriptional regulator [Corynebacterium tapiri]